MIYRGPCFLAVICFGSSPNPFSPFPSVSSTGDTQEDWERETSCWRERRRAGERVSRIIWSQESLVLYEPFNILWVRTIYNNHPTNKNKHITDSYSTPDNSRRQPTALKKTHRSSKSKMCKIQQDQVGVKPPSFRASIKPTPIIFRQPQKYFVYLYSDLISGNYTSTYLSTAVDRQSRSINAVSNFSYCRRLCSALVLLMG